jgi:hypothetical protein
MMSFKHLNCLHRFLQEVMQNDLLMGGKLVVLMGDFRQVLPIVNNANWADIVNATVKTNELWEKVTTF